MALSSGDLSQKIHDAMGEKDSPAAPLKGLAEGIITEIKKGILTHALVSGVTAAGAPLEQGTALAGVISGIIGATMATKAATEMGHDAATGKLNGLCGAVSKHIMTVGKANFESGNITGECTSTAVSPGPLANGQGTDGKIILLVAAVVAKDIADALGESSVSPKLLDFCTGLVNGIMDDAELSYASGEVLGACPPASGPLVGSAAGGKIE